MSPLVPQTRTVDEATVKLLSELAGPQHCTGGAAATTSLINAHVAVRTEVHPYADITPFYQLAV